MKKEKGKDENSNRDENIDHTLITTQSFREIIAWPQ